MIAIVILAAGKSSRLGQKKQLLSWQNTTLLEKSILAAQGSDYSPIVVVIPPEEDILQVVHNHDITIAINHHRDQGVSSSIRLGTQKILDDSDVEAVIFMVCDQPFISADVLRRLGDKYREGHEIVTCQYGETWGIPSLFSRKYFDDILQLQGDRGAKKLLYRYQDKCVSIPFLQGNIDIDTMDEYKKITELDNM
ncbi:nucleotidyltransferase family protein [Candidatus Uabimicrobium amorphum]|uniref:Molybdenum cofactor cytidylyltransferase n=1 Tax=Uabimicrobium amorphum TaxID=2596890 RepID=A0A5S9IIU3_UABAM|nr:nucleotidyltransferase family protein [Candidatus Uabimicrobium amorphum]BBM82181.1 molybdenum cofactor cytidylyltransferase [Candidatus Uabimicrobium amorphum]